MEANNMDKASGNKLIKVGIIGSIIAAICCSTPILVILFGVVGLGALTGYLDYVLFPALAIFIVITVYGFWKKQKKDHECCAVPQK
jgi:mercuric ion transport protein